MDGEWGEYHAITLDFFDLTQRSSAASCTTPFASVPGQREAEKRDGEMPLFLVAKSLQPFNNEALRTMVLTPRKYRDPRGGPVWEGMEAALLPRICDVRRHSDFVRSVTLPK